MNNGILKSITSFFGNESQSVNDMTHLKVGDPAPNFSALNEDGKKITLSDFRGKKLALFFYPADNTPSCTAAACSLRDNYDDLKAQGIEMLGVSPDSTKKHGKFIQKYEFPFSLIADEDLTVLKAYGVWGWKKFMGREFDGMHRVSYILNADKKVHKIIYPVVSAEHAEQILHEIA